MQYKKDAFEAKVIVVGDSGVGKSSIIISALQEEFKFQIPTTLGLDFRTKKVQSTSKIPLRLKMIDTAGQERFKSISNQYYKGCSGALIVFGFDNADSFKNIKHWMRQIKINAGDNVYRLILGNKCDLKQTRKVSEEEVNQLQEQGVEIIEVSALTRQNIEAAIQKLADKLVQENDLEALHKKRRQDLGATVLSKTQITEKDKKCC